ncbi:MAG TPA: hypothetical protein VND64_09995 [Pirellulales bacterium]|nr:hypothetical protein [Pirellulales bacterium]
MSVTLQEPFTPRVNERRRTDAAPLDHPPTSSVGWAPPTDPTSAGSDGWDNMSRQSPAHDCEPEAEECEPAPDAANEPPEKTAEPPASWQTTPRRRTVLSQLLALCGGAEGNTISTNGLCVDLPGELDLLTIDRELSLACPAVAKEESLTLERSLVQGRRCRHPLIVWRFEGRRILLEGHHRLYYCLKHQIPFRVEFLDLPDRRAALEYIHEEQAGKRNLSDEGAAWFRGDRYNREKRRRGGAEREQSVQVEHLKTEERLARELGVSASTIRRDGKLAEALSRIVQNCGLEARHALLARGGGVSRAQIHRLAEMEASEQRDAVDMFFECGKLPSQPVCDDRQTMAFTLPTALAEKLLRHFGVSDVADLAMALVRMKDVEPGAKSAEGGKDQG